MNAYKFFPFNLQLFIVSNSKLLMVHKCTNISRLAYS